MDLKQLKGIGPAKQARLKEAGVGSVEELARCDAAAVAKSTGYTVAAVKELRQRAAALSLVEDVRNLGPASVGTFADEAIVNLKRVYDASADRLAKELKVAQERVAVWQKEVQDSTKRLVEEAQTPEGRKRIVTATKEAAADGARKAQQQARELVVMVEKESKILAQRARDVQEKAPEYVAEARERTQKILRDAQAEIKQVTDRAQARMAADVERVKATADELTHMARSTLGVKQTQK